MPTPRVAAIHDLSGFGRCSLTVAIPILSAMGVQCCPLPIAFLSTHTGGFEGLQQLFAEQVIAYTAHHGNVGTQPCALKRLVGALAAGGHVEGLAVDGLSGMGNLLRGGDDVHDEAAHN